MEEKVKIWVWNFWLVGWVGLVLWHINLYRLLYAKSIFIQIISSVSNNSVLYECNIMAEGFRFMPLDLVRLRTFSVQCMGYLSATLTQVFMRARGADMSLRDGTIAWDGKQGYRVRMMSRTGSMWRIWGIWRKLGELKLDTGQGWLAFASSRGLVVGAARDGRANEKARIDRLCLPLLMSKNL